MNVVLCSIVVLVGLGLLLRSVLDMLKSNRAMTWPTAPGKVVESVLREVNDSEGIMYRPHVLYEYSVNGMALRSDVWRVGTNTSSSSSTKSANKTLARYPVGAAVTVYFNPDQPADAMLEPGKFYWPLFLGGIAFFISGVLGMLQNL